MFFFYSNQNFARLDLGEEPCQKHCSSSIPRDWDGYSFSRPRKICFLVVLAMFLFISIPARAETDCEKGIRYLKEDGNLLAKINPKGVIIAAVEILVWNKMSYAQKIGMLSCLSEVYGKYYIYLVQLGNTNNILAYMSDGRSIIKK